MGEKAEWKIVKEKSGEAAALKPDENLSNAEPYQGAASKQETRARDFHRNSAEGMGAKVVPETECVQRVKFPELQEPTSPRQVLDKIDYLRDVDLEVSVELGNAILSINNILGLDVGSVIELNQTVGEEVRILINGNAYALGEVVVIGEKFGVRILKIIHEQDN